ncbi:MAG: MFS transporter [Candidatus Thorarchaeota archaeon]
MEFPTINHELEPGKLWRLTALSVLNRFANSFTVIILPLYALAIGTDEAFYGLMVAAAGYVQAGTLFPAGTLSDRRGRGITLLLGGIVSGTAFILLPFTLTPAAALVLYSVTGMGTGLTASSLRTLIADYTRRGDDRTRSYGVVDAIGVLAAMAGPFIGGYVLDPSMFPWVGEEMARFALIFFVMGLTRIAAGIFGLTTERWLKQHVAETAGTVSAQSRSNPPDKPTPFGATAGRDSETALLFGLGQAIMGISSGMVVPYLIPWVNAAFTPDPFVLGLVPSIANITLATGTLFVGLTSERTGKLQMILLLYLATPLLTVGLVYAPAFIIMVGFYVTRMSVANMVQPATTSLFMEEVSRQYRARAWAVNRVMWTFPRQTGTVITSLLLTWGIFGGVVEFSHIVFPLAMLLYPISVIPMWIAVRRNRNIRSQESTRLAKMEPQE